MLNRFMSTFNRPEAKTEGSANLSKPGESPKTGSYDRLEAMRLKTQKRIDAMNGRNSSK